MLTHLRLPQFKTRLRRISPNIFKRSWSDSSMPLDPQVRKLLSMLATFPAPDLGKITPQQYREAADRASIQLRGGPRRRWGGSGG